jgi:alpha,alpha-trehalase
MSSLIISASVKPDLKLDVQVLPPVCDDPAFVMSLNDKPGILALAMEKKDGKLQALPFIVPGARFNEKYGWDSVSSPSAAVLP